MYNSNTTLDSVATMAYVNVYLNLKLFNIRFKSHAKVDKNELNVFICLEKKIKKSCHKSEQKLRSRGFLYLVNLVKYINNNGIEVMAPNMQTNKKKNSFFFFFTRPGDNHPKI